LLDLGRGSTFSNFNPCPTNVRELIIYRAARALKGLCKAIDKMAQVGNGMTRGASAIKRLFVLQVILSLKSIKSTPRIDKPAFFFGS
jgi:hypothetical protein